MNLKLKANLTDIAILATTKSDDLSDRGIEDIPCPPASASKELPFQEELALWVVENQIPHGKVDSSLSSSSLS